MESPLEQRWISGADTVPLDDRMLTHGLGVFETMLAVDGRLVRPGHHAERIADACARLGIDAPDWQACLDEIGHRLPPTGWHRVRVARSAGRGRLDRTAGEAPITLLSISPLAPPPESIRVVTARWQRNESSPLSAVKCSSYAESLLALDHARRSGAEEVVFLNTRGRLAEAATANVFLIRDGRFLTPPCADGCLAGTTRRWILESFPEQACEVTLDPAETITAEGVFLCSATRGPVAVSHWDSREIPIPPAFARLKSAWRASIEGDDDGIFRYPG